MIVTIFIVVMFSFAVIIRNNANAQSDKLKEREQTRLAAEVNMTDKMKFLCLQIDGNCKYYVAKEVTKDVFIKHVHSLLS